MLFSLFFLAFLLGCACMVQPGISTACGENRQTCHRYIDFCVTMPMKIWHQPSARSKRIRPTRGISHLAMEYVGGLKTAGSMYCGGCRRFSPTTRPSKRPHGQHGWMNTTKPLTHRALVEVSPRAVRCSCDPLARERVYRGELAVVVAVRLVGGQLRVE